MQDEDRAAQLRKSCSWERRQDKESGVQRRRLGGADEARALHFYDLYWRVEFNDGDWNELTRRELRHGITLTAQVSSSAQEV